MMTTTQNYSHWYGPGMMGAAVATVDITQEINARGEGRMAMRDIANTTEELNLQRTVLMAIQNATDPTENLTMRGKGAMRIASKINELTQNDIMGAVLTTQVAPGLTFGQALIEARKAAKLAAALSA